MSKVGDVMSDILNRPVYMLTERIDSDGDLQATGLADGHFFIVQQDGKNLEFERIDAATAEIQGYAAGVAESMGVRLDTANPFDELAGYLRLDVKCSGGNKPCGKTCIPQRYECKVKGGGGALNSGGKRGLKSGRAIKAGLGIAGGAATLGAGALAANRLRKTEAVKEGVQQARAGIEKGKENKKRNTKEILKAGREGEKAGLKGYKEQGVELSEKQTKAYKKGSKIARKGIAKASAGVENVKTAGRVAKVAGKSAVAAVKEANPFRKKKKEKEKLNPTNSTGKKMLDPTR